MFVHVIACVFRVKGDFCQSLIAFIRLHPVNEGYEKFVIGDRTTAIAYSESLDDILFELVVARHSRGVIDFVLLLFRQRCSAIALATCQVDERDCS